MKVENKFQPWLHPDLDRVILDRAEYERLRSINAELLNALTQVAVLAEYATTGPGKCKSDALTASQATSLRKSISDISRAAIERAKA